MKHLKKFEGYSDDYGMENFTWSDMEFVKDLYNEGMTDPEQIAIEMDWKDMDARTVEQIIAALKSSGEINENVASGLEKETILHILKLKVEDEMKESTPMMFKDESSKRYYYHGRREAFKKVLDIISEFEKSN